MWRLNRFSNHGDTLIEVLFAITVFSLVVVGAISIMNQGVNASQRALQITLVRNEIDAQAETLRFLNSSYLSVYKPGNAALDYGINSPAYQWATMSSKLPSSNVSGFGVAGDTCVFQPTGFIMNTKLAKYIEHPEIKASETFAQVKYNSDDDSIISSEGIWVEAVKVDSGSTNYIDFHIRACWNTPGQNKPATTGTIVRLYEPK
jgi:type II secretory pathway pseudopilin PulG